MLGAFTHNTKQSARTANAAADETYNLAGLNLRDPDEIMPAGETPYTINSRMYARNDAENRVANRTRQGCSFLSDAIGSAQNISNTGTGVADLPFSTTRIIAQPIVPTSTGALTSLSLELKKIGVATGHVIIEVYTNNAGAPSTTMIAQSAIYATGITTAYQFLKAFFTDAPTLTSGVTYWAVIYIQDNGTGSYYLNQTVAGSILDLVSINGQIAWTTINGAIRYKSFLSTAMAISGYTTRYPKDSTQNLIMFSQGINVYGCSISTGIPSLVDSTIDPTATRIRFVQGMNNTYWVDGVTGVKQWTGTGAATVVPNTPTVPVQPTNIIIWQNRMFLMMGNRIQFSELGDYTTWPSTNFFYIPITTPDAADHPTGWRIFQNNLVIFTHLTKYQVIGSNISNFTYKEVVGTKGAVSQEAICGDRDFLYFMADDSQVYKWSGTDDVLLSDKMQPEFQTIQNLNQVHMHLYRNQLRIYYAKAPSAFNNSMALHDLVLQQWFMDTGRNMLGSVALELDDNQLVEFSSVVGMLVYGETQFSDLGKKLDYKFWTNYKTYGYRRRNGQTFGGASAKKRIKRFRPIIRTADADYTMLVGKDMDFANNPDMRQYIVAGGGAKWGGFVFGDGTKWGKTELIHNSSGMSGRGNFIQYRFERKGVETPVELYGYVALYKLGTQK